LTVVVALRRAWVAFWVLWVVAADAEIAGTQSATPSEAVTSRAISGRIERKNPPISAKRLAGGNRLSCSVKYRSV
jgi:hypothetical protein